MSDCRSGRCYDRPVVEQAHTFYYEMPQRSSCSGGSCAPRVEHWQTLSVPPAPYGSFCQGNTCSPSDARAAVMKSFDKVQHDSDVNNNFEFTDKDFSKALAKAAKEGKPLVVVYASDRTPGAMNAAGDTVRSAQASSVGNERWPVKGNAVFVYADTDSAAKNPELSKLMNDKGITGDRARTIIYNAELGADGKAKAVATVLNNDRSDFSGAQLAADIHSAKGYSRPLAIKEVNDLAVKPKEAVAPPAPPAPSAESTDSKVENKAGKADGPESIEHRLTRKVKEMERLQQELEVMKKEMEVLRKGLAHPVVPNAGRETAPMPRQVEAKPADIKPDVAKPGVAKPDVSKTDAPKPVESKPKGPIGIDLLKPDAPVNPNAADQPNQFENRRNQIQANFNRFLDSENRRLEGAVPTVKDDHPTATKETTKWLREQDDMNLLADGDIRNKLNDLGTYFRTSGRLADEDALVQKRSEQWQDLRIQAGNPQDPNHKSKQFMLYEFMTGSHTDGYKFGNANESRESAGGSALRTDRERMSVEAAEALTKIVANPNVKHELSARLIADGLCNTKVPIAARIKLLDAIEPLAKDAQNQYLDGHPRATAVAMVVRSLLKSHQEKENNGDFQRAAMEKLVKMNAEEGYGAIEFLSRESGSDTTRQHARAHLAKLAASVGK